MVERNPNNLKISRTLNLNHNPKPTQLHQVRPARFFCAACAYEVMVRVRDSCSHLTENKDTGYSEGILTTWWIAPPESSQSLSSSSKTEHSVIYSSGDSDLKPGRSRVQSKRSLGQVTDPGRFCLYSQLSHRASRSAISQDMSFFKP